LADNDTISGLRQKIWLSGLGGGQGSEFSGATAQQPAGSLSGTGKFAPGMTGGLSLDQLIQLMGLSQAPATGPGGVSSLTASLGAGSLGQQQPGLGAGSFSQPPSGLIAGDMSSGGAGVSQPSGGTSGVNAPALISKLLGIGSKIAGAGLASPTPGDTAAPAASTPTASPVSELYGQDFATSVGNASPTDYFNQLKAAGLSDAQANDVMMLQTEAPEGRAGFGGAVLPLGSNTTQSSLAQGGGGGATSFSGTPSGTPGSNTFGQFAGGIGAGTGLFGLIQALSRGNTAGAIPGGIQTVQGLMQVLQNSPDFLQNLPQGLQDVLGSKGISSGAGGLAGSALGLIGGLTGSKGISELGADIGGLSQLATTIGPLANAALTGDAAAFEAATAALSAAAPAAAVAAAIQMALTLANDIQAGASPGQTVFDTLASPDVIASAIARNVVDPAFQPSAAWMSFPSRVEQTAGLEEQGLRALMEGLPYIQSKQELGQELGAFKSLIGTQVGGYGQGSGEFSLPNLPEVGTRTHGMPTPPTPADFGQMQQNTQQIINLLSQRLPETGQPFDLMRDLYQFLPRQQFAPIQTGAPIPSPTGGNEGFVEQLFYGSPGYDYAASGYPNPGQFIGSVNPLWAALGLPAFAPSYMGPQVSGGPAVSSPLPTGQTVLPAPDSSVGAAYSQFLTQGYTPDQAWMYAQAIQPQQGSSP